MDPGEQGLAGVSVTASATGVSRAVSSAPDGTFEFTALPAGFYTLTVAPAANYNDGSHVAGSAGGTPGTSAISAITLAATTQAIGYRFAKVPLQTQPYADLELGSLTSSTISPQVGQVFTVTVQVANSGPDTTSAVATVVLPSSVELLSANPSVGTFDPVTGEWVIGALSESANPTMTVELRAGSEGESLLSASIESSDPAGVDPNLSNNVASLNIQVQPALAVLLQAGIAHETRLLVFVDAVHQDAEFVASLASYLDRMGVQHLVTPDPKVFSDELRSGHWNTYWLHPGQSEPEFLAEETISELGIAIFRGDALWIDGARRMQQEVEPWTGAAYAGQRSAEAEAITFTANPYFDIQGLAVSGEKPIYSFASPTQAIANYPDGATAVAVRERGGGRIVVFAFDLASRLVAGVDLNPLFSQLDSAIRPEPATLLTADAYVPLAVRLENEGPAVSVLETVRSPVGSSIVTTSPTPFSLSLNEVVWSTNLGPSEVFTSTVGMRAPVSDGAHIVLVDVAESGAGTSLLAQQSIGINLRGTKQQATILRNDIGALSLDSRTDLAARSNALSALDAAMNLREDGALGNAIKKLIVADKELRRIRIDTSISLAGLASLLQAVQREWYVMLVPCDLSGNSIVRDASAPFAPFSDGQGLAVLRTSTAAEWRLGWDTGDSSNYVMAAPTLLPQVTYVWTLSYDGLGNASLNVLDGANVIASATYSPLVLPVTPLDLGLFTGNAVRLAVDASPAPVSLGSATLPEIVVNVTEVNGVPFSDVLGSRLTEKSVVYYGRSMADGLTLSGSIMFGGMVALDEMRFSVHSGNVSCKWAER